MASKLQQETEHPAVQEAKQETTGTSTQLSLPAPTDASAPSQDTTQTFKLDALGPMIINSDGTLSRIHNWTEMTEAERGRTLRILGKRNQLRRENILAAEVEGESETGTGVGGP